MLYERALQHSTMKHLKQIKAQYKTNQNKLLPAYLEIKLYKAHRVITDALSSLQGLKSLVCAAQQLSISGR